jgi:Ca-activated chloride channel family protein
MRSLLKPHSFTLAIIVLVLAAIGIAQTPTPTPKSKITEEEGIVKVESRLVVIPVAVTDASGQPVQGLKASDFRVLEEGKPQPVDNVATAEAVPLEIALLFDVSSSTGPMFTFEQETAAKFLQEVLREKDRATIFTVGERPILIQSRDTAERSVASIKSIAPTKEQTAFYDSVKAASDYLRKNAPEGTRRVILIISDGEDTNSEGVIQAIWNAERKLTDSVQGQELRNIRVKARDQAKIAEQVKVLKALQDADTVFYSINPAGSSYQLNQMSVFGQENMQKFANDTGGTAFLPKFAPIDTKDQLLNSSNMRKNQATLEQIFRQLASELRAQYLVQYYPETEYPVGRFVKIDVSLTEPTGRKVRARQGYYVKP